MQGHRIPHGEGQESCEIELMGTGVGAHRAHSEEGEKARVRSNVDSHLPAVVLSPGCPLEASREKEKLQMPNVLYFDMDSGYVYVFLCQNS